MELIFGGFVNVYERCKIHLDPLRLGRVSSDIVDLDD